MPRRSHSGSRSAAAISSRPAPAITWRHGSQRTARAPSSARARRAVACSTSTSAAARPSSRLCDAGSIVATAAVEIGGRLVVTDLERCITRLEPAGRRHAARAGFDWRPGEFASAAAMRAVADADGGRPRHAADHLTRAAADAGRALPHRADRNARRDRRRRRLRRRRRVRLRPRAARLLRPRP